MNELICLVSFFSYFFYNFVSFTINSDNSSGSASSTSLSGESSFEEVLLSYELSVSLELDLGTGTARFIIFLNASSLLFSFSSCVYKIDIFLTISALLVFKFIGTGLIIGICVYYLFFLSDICSAFISRPFRA